MGRCAFVFPGQGSQSVGMLETTPVSERLTSLLDTASAAVGRDLIELVSEGPEEALADTRVAQPLLFLTGWAFGSALLERGLKPFAVAGHSLGELTALTVAGALDVDEALPLVVERGRLMSEAASGSPGAMAAVLGLDAEAIRVIVESIDGVWVANDNAPGQIVISGAAPAVADATPLLIEGGARKVVPLKVSGAFHSPLMESARAAFADLVTQVNFSDAVVPVVQNTTPEPATDAQTLRARLIDQITSPVRWTETMAVLGAAGPYVLVEAGPGNVLTGLARRLEGVTAVAASVAGLDTVFEEVS